MRRFSQHVSSFDKGWGQSKYICETVRIATSIDSYSSMKSNVCSAVNSQQVICVHCSRTNILAYRGSMKRPLAKMRRIVDPHWLLAIFSPWLLYPSLWTGRCLSLFPASGMRSCQHRNRPSSIIYPIVQRAQSTHRKFMSKELVAWTRSLEKLLYICEEQGTRRRWLWFVK